MILLGNEIKEHIEDGKISFDGSIKNIGPNSIDVGLQETIKTYVECQVVTFRDEAGEIHHVLEQKEKLDWKWHLNPKKKNKTHEYKIPKEGLIIKPGVLYIGATIEVAGSSELIPMYEGRSSMARLGIQSHLAAGFGDIGFESNWTLEIVVVHPVVVYAKQRIGQVFFYTVNKDALQEMKDNNLLYDSKYSKQEKAQESKSYLDFDDNGNCGDRS